jgi:heat shock protein HslJ
MFQALCFLMPTLAACDESVWAYGGAGATFVLEEIDGAPFAARATLTFPVPGELSGEGPCNLYNAAQLAPYPWFEAGPIAATRRACPDLGAEAAYFEALSAMELAEVLGGVLILSTASGREMVFTAEPG